MELKWIDKARMLVCMSFIFHSCAHAAQMVYPELVGRSVDMIYQRLSEKQAERYPQHPLEKIEYLGGLDMAAPQEYWKKIYKDCEPWVHVNLRAVTDPESFPRQMERTKREVGVNGDELLALCETLYEQYNPIATPATGELRIPKIIHQIWLGGPPPATLKKYMRTWIDNHVGRDWSYVLWTDEMLATLPMFNRQKFDEAWNYALKADIARYEIIYYYGGVYVDADCACLRPLDLLHYTYDFYAGMQPLDTHYLQVGMAIFGARARHPLIAHCIYTIQDDWHRKGIPSKTGPSHFTRSFFACAGKFGSRDVALPMNYFYPLGAMTPSGPRDIEGWIARGAFGVHYWAKTWMPPRFRTAEFCQVKNYEMTERWNDC